MEERYGLKIILLMIIIQMLDIVVMSGELHSRLVCRYIVALISLQSSKK